MADNEKKNNPDINDLKARLGLKSSTESTNAANFETPPPPLGGTQSVSKGGQSAPSELRFDQPSGALAMGPSFGGPPQFEGALLQSDLSGEPIKKRRGGVIVGVLAAAVAGLVVGGVFRSIWEMRDTEKQTIGSAEEWSKKINEQKKVFEGLLTQISDVEKGGLQSTPNAVTALASLKAFTSAEMDTNLGKWIERLSRLDFDANTKRMVLAYYFLIGRLDRDIRSFVQTTEQNQKLLENYSKSITSKDKLGIVIDMRAEMPIGKLVLFTGPAQCPPVAGKPDEKKECAPNTLQVPFVMEPNGKEHKASYATTSGNVIPLVSTEVQRTLLVGDLEKFAFQTYRQQLDELKKLIKETQEKNQRASDLLQKRVKATQT